LWNIVRYAGRPRADKERRKIESELIPLLGRGNANTRREFTWMLSEIGGADSVAALATLLSEPELREDARAALQRIPGRKSLQVLKEALSTGAEDQKAAIAVSLRTRGERINGYPSGKLVPTKKTQVKSIASA
jgi:HEAT repeat protein